MPWNQNTGFIPKTYDEVLLELIGLVNTQFGTSYTPDTFVGTNLYRIFYPVLQLYMETEGFTSLTFNKLQNFFIETNQKLINAVTTDNALLGALKDAGFIASVRVNEIADAGKLAVCVDLADVESDDLDQDISDIADIILTHSFAGAYYDGDITVMKLLSNGQSWPVSFTTPNETPIMLRVTITPSRNTDIVIDQEQVVKDKLMANLDLFYRVGLDFEPEKYFEIVRDAQYASDILLEYSDDGGSTWDSVPVEMDYNEVFRFTVDDISVIFVGI